MPNFKYYRLALFAVLISSAAFAEAQESLVSPTPTIWRFMGIPQGMQKIRDVTTNRRGNHPGLERKPPLTAIADPANLESPNPAIKAAAEIKQAEDMKKQKIKAIKYLASIGCGCYDKDGKITDALLASTDDCTPDVRMAAVEAVGDAASGECCRKCGSTSCCNEKISKRLSEMAYERDDNGCPLEPNAEIRAKAKKVLCICCPGGPPSGPIEEDYAIEDEDAEAQLPTPAADQEEPKVKGESLGDDEAVKGESVEEDPMDGIDEPEEATDEATEEAINEPAEEAIDEATDQVEDVIGEAANSQLNPIPVHVELHNELKADQTDEHDEMLLRHAILSAPVETAIGEVQMIGGMAVQPVTIVPLNVKPVRFKQSTMVTGTEGQTIIPLPVLDTTQTSTEPLPAQAMLEQNSIVDPLTEPHQMIERMDEPESAHKMPSQHHRGVHHKVPGQVAFINYKTGELLLETTKSRQVTIGRPATIYHKYLLGEQAVAGVRIKETGYGLVKAQVNDIEMLKRIRVGDRVLCQ
ncbi:hypothetical protein CA13_47620 [Planctomycetes bacterium CA13]|uniref:HEAT repeat protein n=1 Tax=Novipirellula herctigrandis TaxID=2527986 RepID=A0A5C5Z870_9BACT|nr:hypothetical protein CA13_47620 [Planctomycetes bacterium CA13]